MMEFFNGCSALITGASSGLGAEFANQLAPVANRLVLVARRNDRLEEMAAKLRNINPHLDVRIFSTDLVENENRHALADWLISEGIDINFLINNAGLGDHGLFESSDWTRVQNMLDLNITALTHLSHLLVNSVAGFFPLPQMAVYSATKAYVTSFSEALAMELRPKGITVTALCPGPVPTEFFDVATRPGHENSAEQFKIPPAFVVSPQDAVLAGLEAVARDRARVIPGPLLAAAVGFALLVPFCIVRHFLKARAASL